MKTRWLLLVAAGAGSVMTAAAADWPQWRGPNRDAKAEFNAPTTWPKELTKKWSVPAGSGVATPALAGGKLYVFAREEGDEILSCLDADTGKELWRDKNASPPVRGAAGSL